MLKSKKFLAALAFVLVLALAVTGTLMLFTAQTKVATNRVKIDGLKIDLQEEFPDGWRTIGEDGEGLYFDDFVPNGEIDKNAQVIGYPGNVDAYLRVAMDVVWDDIPASITDEARLALIATAKQKIEAGIMNSVQDFLYDGDYFYYVGDGNGQPPAEPPYEEYQTVDLESFSAADIASILAGLDSAEWELTNDEWDALTGLGFIIDIIAEAVQVSGNPYGSGDTYITAFAAGADPLLPEPNTNYEPDNRAVFVTGSVLPSWDMLDWGGLVNGDPVATIEAGPAVVDVSTPLDADTITYTIIASDMGDALEIDPATGEVTVNDVGDLPLAVGTYTFTVMAENPYGYMTRTFSVTVE